MDSSSANYEVVCVGTPKGVKVIGRPFTSRRQGSKKRKVISYHKKYRPAVKKAQAVVKKGAKRCMVRSKFKDIYTTGRF